jgi:hypothetical protein
LAFAIVLGTAGPSLTQPSKKIKAREKEREIGPLDDDKPTGSASYTQSDARPKSMKTSKGLSLVK